MKKPESFPPACHPSGVIPAGRIHFWPIDRWRALQRRRLRQHLAWAAKSPLNRQLARRTKTGRGVITADDLLDLPIITKQELALAESGALAVPTDRIAEWVTTSGTTGRPLQIGLTARDLSRLAENEAVALNLAGLQPGDTLLLAVAMDRMFIAGLAYWLGSQKIGAACVRIGSQFASTAQMLCAWKTLSGRKFLMTVPSLASQLSISDCPLRLEAVIGIGEPLLGPDLRPNALAACVAKSLALPADRVLSTYASTETCTTFAQGPRCKGGHLNPRLGWVEILDDQNQPVNPGTPGNIVITPLGVEGMPLVRFATGDIAALYTAPCPCGRTTPRLGPILGRQSQLLKVRGTSLYPAAIFDVLNSIRQIEDYLLVVESTHDLSDKLAVYVHFTGGKSRIPHLCRTLKAVTGGRLKVTPDIRICSREELAAFRAGHPARKPIRFLDRRGR